MTPQELIREAQDNLTLCELHEREIRAESKRCNKFLALEQWDQQDLDSRAGRISVVIDQLGQYRDQVVNDWRRNRLGIKVSPMDSPADPETARVIDGLIRQIEYQSKAHVAYDYAFESMTGGNRGFCQVAIKRRPGTFKQDICILKIPNPDSVYIDPFCREVDYSDMTFAIKVQKMRRKDYEKSSLKPKITDFSSASKLAPTWFPDSESLLLAEYWKVKEIPRTIQLLTKPIPIIRGKRALTTDVVYSDEYDQLPAGVEVMRDENGDLMQDDEPERRITCYLLSATEILSEDVWPGTYIPIIPWYGKEVWYEGKKKLFSLISRSLDAQKGANYAYSALFERLGQRNLAPVVGYLGQFKTMRKQWEQMNTHPVAFLEADPVMVGDQPAPLPQRADFDPRIDQTTVATSMIKDAVRSTMGINTAILGQDTGKAKSGIAIKALQKEGDNATFDFLDNGARALELTGCVILDLIPKVYSDADIVHIRDEQQQTVAIAINQDINAMQQPPQNQTQNFFITDGKYHVAVTAAPSHESLRQEGQEAVRNFIDLMDPQMRAVALPVAMRLSDQFGMQDLADAIDPPKGKMNPKAMAQQMQQMMQALQVLTQEVQELNKEKEQKTIELASQEKQKAIQVLGQIRVAEINASKDLDRTKADQDAEALRQIMNQAHEVGMQAAGVAQSNAVTHRYNPDTQELETVGAQESPSQ